MMGFSIPNPLDLLPADPVAYVKEKVILLLNYLGCPWPMTEPELVRAAGAEWESLRADVDGWIEDMESSVDYLGRNNSGEAMTQVRAYFDGSESNLDALRFLSDAISGIKFGYDAMAAVADALRLAVIAEILLDAVQLALAIISGGLSAGASFLVKQGAGAVIDYLIDQAIEKIMAGA